MYDVTRADSSAFPTAIDRSVLEEFRSEMGDDELVAELIETFLVDSKPRIAAMQEASRRGDVAAASREAHAVKGSAGHFGARQLARLCGELEHGGHDGHPRVTADLVRRVVAEYERVRVALKSVLQQLA